MVRKNRIVKTILVDQLKSLNCDWVKKRPRNDDENPVTVFNCNLGDRELWKEFGGFKKVNILDPLRTVALNFDISKGSGGIIYHLKTGTECHVKDTGGRFKELHCYHPFKI